MSGNLPGNPAAPPGCAIPGAGILVTAVVMVLLLMAYLTFLAPFFAGPQVAPSGGQGN